MNKKLKGYLTLEASYVMPIVLLLYVLIILSGFYLYDRCVISQNNSLLALRGSRFTDAADNYGEVIYGDMEMGSCDESYLLTRLDYKERFYPFYTSVGKSASIQDGKIVIATEGIYDLKITKKAEQINPIEIIREVRRQ